MGKFPFKRPRIISKKFPEMNSSIDGVRKSLNDLVFSYSEKVDRALQKKHLLMALSSMVLLVVLGSFINPHGKAESATFYPDTCLGGWVNPHNAEGILQTTSNGDASQFTKDNSAVLPKNTDAEMYCGSFKGKFDPNTRPTKIVVSLALTKGEELLLEDRVESGSFASSSTHILDAASTTDVSFTLTSSSSTDVTPIKASSSSQAPDATSAPATSSVDTAIATPVTAKGDGTSVVNGIVQSVQDTVNKIFDTTPKQPVIETDTVVVPPPVVPVTSTDTPQSYLSPSKHNILSRIVDTVFAEEEAPSSSPLQDPVVTQPSVDASASETQTVIVPTIDTPISSTTPEATKTPDVLMVEPSSTNTSIVSETASSISVNLATTTPLVATTTASTSEILSGSTTPDVATDTNIATTTDENQFQNNFLEVLYTFDGTTWTSLGELNEISMKYRTFEIPVNASTSWSDMSQLQIKVQSKRHIDQTPTVYLDGIKVEVLYDTALLHTHPDFARDTILRDETFDGIRVVTIVNNENKQQETWYMYVDDATSTDEALTSALDASGTIMTANLPLADSTSTDGTTTDAVTASTTNPLAKPVIDTKHVWKKFLGKDDIVTIADIVQAIRKQEALEKLEALDLLPDFASDTIKRMKGVLSNTVLVQIERGIQDETRDELWLYNLEKNTEERIGAGTTTVPTTIAPDSPLGIKSGYLFWLSVDKKTVYTYNVEDKKLLQTPLPVFNVSNGERAEMNFEGVPWKVIVSGDGFSFSSPQTGEVFSDDDASTVEQLRTKMGLDTVLNKEELSNLSLPVSAEEATGTPK